MKLGIVIYSNDSEIVWNAFRFGNLALVTGDEVKVFLIGKGVELESIETTSFNVTEQLQTFVGSGGKIFACSTCLEIRQLKASEMYTVAGIKELYDIVKESDKVIAF